MNVRFNLDPKERLSIWEFPDPKDSYIIGGDGSDGVIDGDNSCAQVLSRNKFKQVAVWHGKMEPYQWGHSLFALGLYYNTALLAVERNSSGVTTIDCLRKLDYPNLFQMRKFDQGEQEVMDRYGWVTNVHSRGLMLGTLREVVRENSLILSDPDTLAEMKTFIKNRDTGKLEASGGNHDDRVIALAITCHLHRSLDPPVVLDRPFYAERLGLDFPAPYLMGIGRGGY